MPFFEPVVNQTLADRLGSLDLKEVLARPGERQQLIEELSLLSERCAEAQREALGQIARTLAAKRLNARKFQQQLEALRIAIAHAETSGGTAGESAAAEDAGASSDGSILSGALAQDPQLIADFLVEAKEHLSNIEAQLLALEHNPKTQEALHSAFRSFHTIKGLAGFLEFGSMQEVSHEVETVLDLARNSVITLNAERIDVILNAGDYLSSWLRAIQDALHGGKGTAPEFPKELVDRIRRAAQEDPAEPPAAPGAATQPAAGAPVSVEGEPQPAPKSETEAAPAPEKAKAEASVLKVNTAKLEYLVDMVGELVIAQSMLRHNPDLTASKTPRLQRDLAQLSRVTAEVQKTAMAMRMVPVGNLFRRMIRLVRDLSRKSGKLAELEMFGEDVELDRTIVEELADPVVHMLRNSMDHGLEKPEEREAAGKPRTGKIRLKAAHQAGQIFIEISDDGRGLNREKILAKAISKGLVDSGESLSDADIYELIFQPGFSTAEKVTDVSGRGVGMDVVRQHIARLRGSVEIQSEAGQGTRFLLKLPLTLAIIDGLVVVIGGERFIVPLFAVREMIKPTADMIFTVENRAEMALVRGRLMPVIRLSQKLKIPPKSADPAECIMIVSEIGGKSYCLTVDELAGKQEVVIKSLGPVFQDVRGVAGGAILGDGRVGLILDVAALIQ